jgi:hypothetical protein
MIDRKRNLFSIHGITTPEDQGFRESLEQLLKLPPPVPHRMLRHGERCVPTEKTSNHWLKKPIVRTFLGFP